MPLMLAGSRAPGGITPSRPRQPSIAAIIPSMSDISMGIPARLAPHCVEHALIGVVAQDILHVALHRCRIHHLPHGHGLRRATVMVFTRHLCERHPCDHADPQDRGALQLPQETSVSGSCSSPFPRSAAGARFAALGCPKASSFDGSDDLLKRNDFGEQFDTDHLARLIEPGGRNTGP